MSHCRSISWKYPSHSFHTLRAKSAPQLPPHPPKLSTSDRPPPCVAASNLHQHIPEQHIQQHLTLNSFTQNSCNFLSSPPWERSALQSNPPPIPPPRTHFHTYSRINLDLRRYPNFGISAPSLDHIPSPMC